MSETVMENRLTKDRIREVMLESIPLPEAGGPQTASEQSLLSPAELIARMPVNKVNVDCVQSGRDGIRAILDGSDRRLLVIVGPCSIHDYDSALEYAQRLNSLSKQLSDRLCLVMRCYFEKPRTALGWKGLINDPYLDGSCDIAAGIAMVRRLLLDITGLGVPVATEALEPNLANYYQDLVSWTAIGARTAESQPHRQFASGLNSPVGVKNATNGCIDTAVNALLATRASHCFAGIDRQGRMSAIKTTGNRSSHIILRGGRSGPNYDTGSIALCKSVLAKAGIDTRIIVDCSHANSGKRAVNQERVVENLIGQIAEGEQAIAGLMLESHLKGGRQEIDGDSGSLRYGVSITDECIGWESTETLLRRLHQALTSL